MICFVFVFCFIYVKPVRMVHSISLLLYQIFLLKLVIIMPTINIIPPFKKNEKPTIYNEIFSQKNFFISFLLLSLLLLFGVYGDHGFILYIYLRNEKFLCFFLLNGSILKFDFCQAQTNENEKNFPSILNLIYIHRLL